MADVVPRPHAAVPPPPGTNRLSVFTPWLAAAHPRQIARSSVAPRDRTARSGHSGSIRRLLTSYADSWSNARRSDGQALAATYYRHSRTSAGTLEPARDTGNASASCGTCSLYWDIHRHQLPPSAGLQIRSLVDTGRLHVAPRESCPRKSWQDASRVELRAEAMRRTERRTFDHVINCHGSPDYNPRLRSRRHSCDPLVAAGHLTPDPARRAASRWIAVGRPNRTQPSAWLRICTTLGPWLRGRFSGSHWPSRNCAVTQASSRKSF
jgi:hypothetical protein